MSRSHKFYALMAPLLAGSMLLSACSGEKADDVAVAKMPAEQVQATNYLALNPDKPGTMVHAERYLVPGKYNIVAYLSPYDQASVNYEQGLMRLAQTRGDLAIRTININRPEVRAVDWQSPIVVEDQIQSLPYFVIFDPSQQVRAKGRPAFEQITQWIQPASPVQQQ